MSERITHHIETDAENLTETPQGQDQYVPAARAFRNFLGSALAAWTEAGEAIDAETTQDKAPEILPVHEDAAKALFGVFVGNSLLAQAAHIVATARRGGINRREFFREFHPRNNVAPGALITTAEILVACQSPGIPENAVLSPEQARALFNEYILVHGAPIRSLSDYGEVIGAPGLIDWSSLYPVKLKFDQTTGALLNYAPMTEKAEFLTVAASIGENRQVIIPLSTLLEHATAKFGDRAKAVDFLSTKLSQSPVIPIGIQQETYLASIVETIVADGDAVQVQPKLIKKDFIISDPKWGSLEFKQGLMPAGVDIKAVQLRGSGDIHLIIMKDGKFVGMKPIPQCYLDLDSLHFELRHLRDSSTFADENVLRVITERISELKNNRSITMQVGERTLKVEPLAMGTLQYDQALQERGLSGELVKGLVVIKDTADNTILGMAHILERPQKGGLFGGTKYAFLSRIIGDRGYIDEPSLVSALYTQFKELLVLKGSHINVRVNGSSFNGVPNLSETAGLILKKLSKGGVNLSCTLFMTVGLPALPSVLSVGPADLDLLGKVIIGANSPSTWVLDQENVLSPTVGALVVNQSAFKGRSDQVHAIPYFNQVDPNNIAQRQMLTTRDNANVLAQAYIVTSKDKPDETDFNLILDPSDVISSLYTVSGDRIIPGEVMIDRYDPTTRVITIPESSVEINEGNFKDCVVKAFTGTPVPGFNFAVAMKPIKVVGYKDTISYQVITKFNGKIYAMYFIDGAVEDAALAAMPENQANINFDFASDERPQQIALAQ